MWPHRWLSHLSALVKHSLLKHVLVKYVKKYSLCKARAREPHLKPEQPSMTWSCRLQPAPHLYPILCPILSTYLRGTQGWNSLLNVWVPPSLLPSTSLLSYPGERKEDFMHQIPSGPNCHFRIRTVLMNAKTVFSLDRAWQDQQSQIREKLLAFQQRLINSDSIKSILINYAERYYCCL